MPGSQLSLSQAIKSGIQQLQFSDSAKLDSEILLLKVLNNTAAQRRTKTWLLTWPEKELTLEQLQQFNQYLELRSTGMPIAYITGEKEFWTLSLKVTSETLIPRPETELLVEKALEKVAIDSNKNILDLGTGSGAIALSIASEREFCHILATDSSQAALEVAQDNAKNLKINNISFLKSHWFNQINQDTNKFDMIISNPPYIAENDLLLEKNVLKYEPTQALISSDNGMADISEIIKNCLTYLTQKGWILFEHGYQQADEVQNLLKKQGFSKINTINDLNHQPRVTLAQLEYSDSGTA